MLISNDSLYIVVPGKFYVHASERYIQFDVFV